MVTETRLGQICNTCNENNTSVYEGAEYRPHELVFERSARVPYTSSILSDDKSSKSYLEYATALFNRIFDVQASACENFEHAKIRFKQYYDRKANLLVFNKDDYIYLLKEPLRGKFDELIWNIWNIKDLIGF